MFVYNQLFPEIYTKFIERVRFGMGNIFKKKKKK